MKKLFVPIVLGLAGSGFLLWLCLWQIDRLAWKQDLIKTMSAQLNAPSKSMGDLGSLDLKNIDGQPFEATGIISDTYVDLLSGNADGAGYRRIVSMKTNTQTIMVELGFLSEGDKEKSLTTIGKAITINGNLYAPKGSGTYDAKRNIWIGYDLDKMSKSFNAPPAILVAKTSPETFIQSAPYEISLPNNHAQYAITWGLLALAWGVMSVYWGYSRYKVRR